MKLVLTLLLGIIIGGFLALYVPDFCSDVRAGWNAAKEEELLHK